MDRREFLEVATGSALMLSMGSISQAKPKDERVLVSMGQDDVSYMLIQGDVPNSNNRIYPRSVLKNICDNFKKDNREILGGLEMTTQPLPLSEASHRVTNLWLLDDPQRDCCYLMANIEVLPTPDGAILRSLLNENLVTFRTAGTGGCCDMREPLVISVYHLISVHAVPNDEAAIWD